MTTTKELTEENRTTSFAGQVTLDGQLLQKGAVTFVQEGEAAIAAGAATGRIDSDGTYSLEIAQTGSVSSGEYAVKVVAREDASADPGGGPPNPGALTTPERYARTKTSGLRYNVRRGRNTIDIAIVSDASEPVAMSEDSPTTDEEEGESPDVAAGDEGSIDEPGSSIAEPSELNADTGKEPDASIDESEEAEADQL